MAKSYRKNNLTKARSSRHKKSEELETDSGESDSDCELNFIEFFWGAIKKYLCDNCDYTFDTLKENMPKALESVQLQTIQ